jgi:hypothetical protein
VHVVSTVDTLGIAVKWLDVSVVAAGIAKGVGWPWWP